MDYTRLTGESPEYLHAREQLRLADIGLMQQSERVAEMRRALPLGPVVDDYEFLEGPRSLDQWQPAIDQIVPTIAWEK